MHIVDFRRHFGRWFLFFVDECTEQNAWVSETKSKRVISCDAFAP